MNRNHSEPTLVATGAVINEFSVILINPVFITGLFVNCVGKNGCINREEDQSLPHHLPGNFLSSISYPSPTGDNPAAFISASTMIFTSSENLIFAFHPSFFSARDGSARSASTSVGLKYF